ncbi:MAG: ComEC/Rec2 family competence protein, partial [Spirochaetales bacterium]|nr:ComEC/Rec2 family competence protein [Spirochaetales bacterium]
MNELKKFWFEFRSLVGFPVYLSLLMIAIVIIAKCGSIVSLVTVTAGLIILLCLVFWFDTSNQKTRHIITAAALLVCCIIWTVMVRQRLCEYRVALSEMEHSEQSIGVVSEYPKHKTVGGRSRTEFEFRIIGIKNSEVTDFIKVRPFRVIVSCSGDCELLKGDKVLLRQPVSVPDVPESGFNYREYLHTNGIYGQVRLRQSDIETLERELPLHSDGLRRMKQPFYRWRDRVIERFRASLSLESFGFFVSVFLGIRSELDSDISENFRDSGMMHLIAISGMHISVIGGFIFALLRMFMSRSKSYIISAIVLSLYVGLLSFQPSSARAFITYCIVAGFFVFGHSSGRLTRIALAAIVLMLINPFCIFNIGFQFSFLATIGIILFNDEFGDILQNVMPAKFLSKIRDNLSVTLSAFVSVSFVQACIFGQLAVFSLITSLLLIKENRQTHIETADTV